MSPQGPQQEVMIGWRGVFFFCEGATAWNVTCHARDRFRVDGVCAGDGSDHNGIIRMERTSLSLSSCWSQTLFGCYSKRTVISLKWTHHLQETFPTEIVYTSHYIYMGENIYTLYNISLTSPHSPSRRDVARSLKI